MIEWGHGSICLLVPDGDRATGGYDHRQILRQEARDVDTGDWAVRPDTVWQTTDQPGPDDVPWAVLGLEEIAIPAPLAPLDLV
jgi:hypothetical protein